MGGDGECEDDRRRIGWKWKEKPCLSFATINRQTFNFQLARRERERERESKNYAWFYICCDGFSQKSNRFASGTKSCVPLISSFFLSSCQAYTIQNPHTQQTADRKPMKIYFWERWKTINGNSLVNGSVWVEGEALRVNTILKRLFAPLLDHFSLLLVLNKKWKCKQQPQQRRRQKQSFTSSSSSLSSLWLAFSVCVRFCWHAHIHKSHATNWFQA